MSTTDLCRARRATLLVFFTTGVVFATWASRIPAVQDQVGLSPGGFGVAILGLEGGAILGLPLGGALVTRMGSRLSLRLGFAVFPPALCTVAWVPTLPWLALALGVMAAGNSVVDVAMNAQGVELERRVGRPLLAGLHAGHSFGALGGGLLGTAAAATGVHLQGHLGVVAVVSTVMGGAATTWLLSEEPEEDGATFGWPGGRLLLFGAIAFCAFLLDGAANNWTAVHLRTELGASPSLAAAGFTAFALTVALGRLVGDRAVARFGRARIVRVSGVVAVVGVGLAMTAPSAPVAVGAWAILGGGVAMVAPAVLGAAADRTPAPVAIAAVSTVGYLGSFSGPPLVGALAGLTGLSAALGLLLVASASIAFLAHGVADVRADGRSP